MIQDAIDAFGDMVSPPFRRVLGKSIALTLAILALVGLGADRLAVAYVASSNGWLATAISVLIGLGLVIGLVWLAAPTTSLVAGFFLDEIAGLVERKVDPYGPPGRAAPILDALIASLRFAALSAVIAIAALFLLFLPGFGFLIWIAANAYVLGAQYFELAAMRFRSAAEARAMRRHFGGTVFLSGLIVAAFVSVPLLNLATPLFAAALMARLHKRLSLNPSRDVRPSAGVAS